MNNGLLATEAVNANLLDENYSINTLICINSAHHGYSEIPLDKHMVLYGANNKGKTVTLNMMKLALFPDTSFKRCADKFAFRSKDGSYYDGLVSHKFYFPSEESYIIIEGENPQGRYCMVLFRSKDLGYGRVFVGASYDEIRPLFWQQQTATFANDLKFSTVFAGLKKFKHKQITDDGELAQIMFDGYRQSDELARRFCVFPFSGDVSNDTISAFRRVYQLAFDTHDNKETTLPKALATLIEMKRGRAQERLDANLVEMASDHERLLTRGEQLTNFQNQQPQWLQVEQAHQNLVRQHGDYSREFSALEQSVSLQLQQSEARQHELQSLFEEARLALRDLKQQGKEAESKKREHDGAVKQQQRAVDEQEQKLSNAKQKHASYGSLSSSEILATLNEYRAEQEQKLHSYQDQQSRQQRFTMVNERKQRNSQRLAQLQAQQAGDQQALAEQLSVSAQTIIHSLNQQLARAPIALQADTKNQFEQFAQLFTVMDSGLTLQQQLLQGITLAKPLNAAEKREQLKQDIQQLSNKIDDDSRELIEIKQSLAGQDNQTLIEKIKQEIKDTDSDIGLIEGLSTFERELPVQRNQLEQMLMEQASLAERVSQLQAQLEPLEARYNDSDRQLKASQEQLQLLSNARTQLQRVKQMMQPQLQSNQNEEGGEISAQALQQLENQALALSRQLLTFNQEFERLVMAVKHPDIELFKQRHTLAAFSDDMALLSKLFATLDYELNQYKKNVRTHNQLVNNQLRELRDAEQQIRHMTAAINEDLNSKQISNLSEVALEIKLRPSFLTLLDKLNKHNIEDDTLAERSFYEEIQTFAKNHYNKQSHRIKLADIIERVDYSYRHEDSDKRVTEGQSGGTTSAVTAFVLSILLKQIVSQNYSMRLPIVVDEIGTLDSKNTKAVVNQIIDHGFILFCATPNFSPSLNRIVGRTLNMDAAVVSEPRVEDCFIHISPQHIDHFGLQHEA